MSKAMLIMDMPESCEKCKLSRCLVSIGVGRCCVDGEKFDDMTKVQDWCPLREVPEKQNLDIQTCSALSFSEEEIDMARGYNACIDEILGGNDEK